MPQAAEPPFLETARLSLRAFTPDDIEKLVTLDADPEVRRYLDRPNPTTPGRAAADLARFRSYYGPSDGRFGFWAAHARDADDAPFLGWFHLRPEEDRPDELSLGYRLLRAYWGRGYATEGARALVRRAFAEYGVAAVSATALEENEASRRVMEKAGLRLAERYDYKPGMPAVRYLLTRAAWEAAGGTAAAVPPPI